MPYPLTQNMLFVILLSPGSPAGPLFSLFFGWWAKPGVDTSALWDHYPLSCIRVAFRGDELVQLEGHTFFETDGSKF